MEDRALIRRIKQGDKEAFEQLVSRHYQNIFAYCYRRTASREDAEDLTQEVFLRLVRAVYKYQNTGRFSNFIFTIAVNCCNDFLRKKVRQTSHESGSDVPLQLAEERPGPEASAQAREENAALYHRLAGLSDPQREALILYYFHGFKAREVAAITGAPLATAKSRIRQGMAHLRRIYEEEGKEER